LHGETGRATTPRIMLLIHPPVAKPCEPPAGIARLAGFLRSHGRPCTLLDANLEGPLYLLATPVKPHDTWGRRASKNLAANLIALRTPQLYKSPDRYRRAVADVNRVLELAAEGHNMALSLANYQDRELSPQKSADLLRAAEQPEKNIFYPYFAQRLPQVLETENPSLIGFSVNYLSQALCAFAMAGFLKKHYPDLPLVLGGGLVTTWLRNPDIRNPFTGLIDHLVAGPGEEPLLRILGVNSEERGNTRPPDYRDLPLNDYLAPGRILPYAASSGCYWRKCSFCPEKAEGNPYLPLPSERVLEEIDGLTAATKPILLHLLDNAVSPALLRGLTDRPPGVNWYGFARISPQLTDVDFCRSLRQSGCVLLKLGIESGDQGVLDAMDKGIDQEMVDRALTALKKAGIATYVYLLFGTPTESINEARSTLRFVERHHRAVTFLNLAIFNLPIRSAEAKGLDITDFYEGDLALYSDFAHPKGWDRREVRRFLSREFKRRPLIADILRRDPYIFTSNHAAFFC